MAITYRTSGVWGAGKGSALLNSEIDGNFYDLVTRILSLENDPLDPVGIQSIEATGNQFKVILTDASEQGPFSIPLSLFKWQGEWQPLTAYNELDVFFVDSEGVYVVLKDHTSVTEFNELESDTETFYYHKLFEDSSVYDLAYYVPGEPGAGLGAGSPILQVVIGRNLLLPETTTEDSSGLAYLGTPVTTTEDFQAIIRRNGTQIGTIDIATGANAGVVTITANTLFAPGDVLSVDQPTPDGEGADLSITISAIRGVTS